jgi:hypothetical protein
MFPSIGQKQVLRFAQDDNSFQKRQRFRTSSLTIAASAGPPVSDPAFSRSDPPSVLPARHT